MKKQTRTGRRGERGAALVEFAIAATLFLAAMFGVLELSRMLWVHNALTDATRRGARYAITQGPAASAQTAIKNMTVYGNPAGTGTPMVDGLTTDNVFVDYNAYELGKGTVTVHVENYDFRFVLPLVGTTIRMPAYSTTLTGETAGFVPPNI
ncbi:MAG TPA: TadE/TadG family type IV pilus assembly protein [Pyrinomonadaceae bacterium]|jgi:Flp pilus assembly protein TadG